jgi:hypothetical protein
VLQTGQEGRSLGVWVGLLRMVLMAFKSSPTKKSSCLLWPLRQRRKWWPWWPESEGIHEAGSDTQKPQIEA